MKPFLFNRLLDVNTNLSIQPAGLEGIEGVVIDSFLKHPVEVRKVLGESPVANWKISENSRNFKDYYDCRLRLPVLFPCNLISVAAQAIYEVWKVDTRPQDPSADINWFMQINEKRSDFAVPHHDFSSPVKRSFTCLVYLNDAGESSGGTAFFRFRPSGSLKRDPEYDHALATHPKLIENGQNYWASETEEFWSLAGNVKMKPGRLLIFPSEYYHAAHHPKNGFYKFPRMTLAFWMLH